MSTYGFPDGQEITQWLGQILAQGTAAPLGAGSIVLGPFSLANFASVIVALKATGGNVTLKVTQSVKNGPPALSFTTTVPVAAGPPFLEAFVLFGDSVTIEIDGLVGGTTLDYAVYPSNTTTNSQITGNATPTIPRVTALPGSPSDGQLCSLVPDQANHPEVEWLCIFNLGTGYWDVIGGPPIVVRATAAVTMNALSAWFDLLTKWTCPVAGDFLCTFNAAIQYNSGTCQTLVVGVGAGGSPGFFEWFTLDVNALALATYSGMVPVSATAGQVIALYGDPQGGAAPSMTSQGPGNAATQISILPTRIK